MGLTLADYINQQFGVPSPGAVNDKLRAFYSKTFTGNGSPVGVVTGPGYYFDLLAAAGTGLWYNPGADQTGWTQGGVPNGTYVPIAGSHLSFDPTGLTGPAVLITGITGDALQLYGSGSPTQPLFVIDHLGVLHFGPGAAAATDTSLSRPAAGVLASNGGFQIANGSAYGSTGDVYIQASGATHAVNIGDVGATYMVIQNGTFGVFSKTGTPVAQATATPAAATDLASAISLVNAIRTAQLAYGWMA